MKKKEKEKTHERFEQGALQVSPLISILSSFCTRPALKTALVLLFPTGITRKPANCALPRGTFYIHRHDSRIWIFICNIQTISCSPGRLLLAGKLAGNNIVQKKRAYLDTLENTKKKTEEAFHSSLIRTTFYPNP